MPFFVFDKVILAFQENNDTIFYVLLYTSTTRKDAGVVDRDGLENRCTLTGTEGSNPSLSATETRKPQQVPSFSCLYVALLLEIANYFNTGGTETKT